MWPSDNIKMFQGVTVVMIFLMQKNTQSTTCEIFCDAVCLLGWELTLAFQLSLQDFVSSCTQPCSSAQGGWKSSRMTPFCCYRLLALFQYFLCWLYDWSFVTKHFYTTVVALLDGTNSSTVEQIAMVPSLSAMLVVHVQTLWHHHINKSAASHAAHFSFWTYKKWYWYCHEPCDMAHL